MRGSAWLVTGLAIAVLVSGPANAQTSGMHAKHSHGRMAARGPRGGLIPAGFVPKHARPVASKASFGGKVVSGGKMMTPGMDVEIVEGATYYEDPKTGKLVPGNPMEGGIVEMGDQPMAVTGSCVDGSCGTCSDCCLVPCGVAWPRGNLEGFVGVQGFTGPANRPDGSGSFGFNEGLNWGMPLPAFGCLGGQFGARAVQSNLSGADFTDDTGTQVFVTGGFFRRVDVGLQGGLVIDYMTETWYHDLDLLKLRGEVSWMFAGTHDLGFWFSGAARTSTIASGIAGAESPTETWEGTDVYAVFYRRHFQGCLPADARVLAGWSNDSDGLIAFEGRLPLGDRWWLEGSAWYLIPSEGTGRGFEAGHTQESWNVGINLVLSLDRILGHGVDPYYRPLFGVADNGSFMFDRR